MEKLASGMSHLPACSLQTHSTYIIATFFLALLFGLDNLRACKAGEYNFERTAGLQQNCSLPRFEITSLDNFHTNKPRRIH